MYIKRGRDRDREIEGEGVGDSDSHRANLEQSLLQTSNNKSAGSIEEVKGKVTKPILTIFFFLQHRH